MTRSNTNRRNQSARRLSVQNLETRKLMAGDIDLDLSFSGSNMDIRLTGDSANNGVEVRQIGGNLHITGLNHDGTGQTTIDGAITRIVPMNQIQGGQIRQLDDIRVNLNNGNDYLLMRNVNMGLKSHSDLSVNTGRGSDRIYMKNVYVRDDVTLRDHTSDTSTEQWNLSDVTVGDEIDAEMYAGIDTFVAARTDADKMDIDTGSNNDFVSLMAIDVNELDVDLSSGNDRLRIDASDAGDADLDGGSGVGDILDVNGNGYYANAFDAVAASEDFETIWS